MPFIMLKYNLGKNFVEDRFHILNVERMTIIMYRFKHFPLLTCWTQFNKHKIDVTAKAKNDNLNRYFYVIKIS